MKIMSVYVGKILKTISVQFVRRKGSKVSWVDIDPQNLLQYNSLRT